MSIQGYSDFIKALTVAGFSMAGGNDEGIFAVVPWGWKSPPPYRTPVEWHTGDTDTDPWEWRIRVLDERDDIAYAKLFLKKGGFITREWYPYFLAVRRCGKDFYSEYAEGGLTNQSKRIYDIICEYQVLPVQAIKQLAGFGKEDKSQFDRALTELQMKMYLTMCGRQHKLTKKGEEYGWSSMVFCRSDTFFSGDVFKKAQELDRKEAIGKILSQIYILRPDASEKKALKFIEGR